MLKLNCSTYSSVLAQAYDVRIAITANATLRAVAYSKDRGLGIRNVHWSLPLSADL
jgi:hypothetical protein